MDMVNWLAGTFSAAALDSTTFSSRPPQRHQHRNRRGVGGRRYISLTVASYVGAQCESRTQAIARTKSGSTLCSTMTERVRAHAEESEQHDGANNRQDSGRGA